MKLPFNSTDFFNVFGLYNSAVWPLQTFAYVLALFVLFLYLKRHPDAGKATFILLSLLWLINGIGYHLIYFSAINKAAFVFGGLFVVQALLFAWMAYKTPIAPPEIMPARRAAAVAIILYAMVLYSLIGHFSGHVYPNAPVFGVAPCPTVIFTFGVLLLSTDRLRWALSLIPLLWALVGTSAAFVLGVREDFGLAAAAALYVLLSFR